jgi:hypothetical protein
VALQPCERAAAERVRDATQAKGETSNRAAVCAVKLAGQDLPGAVQPGQAIGRKAGGRIWLCLLWPCLLVCRWQWGGCVNARLAWGWRCYRLGNSDGLTFDFPDKAGGCLWWLEGADLAAGDAARVL